MEEVMEHTPVCTGPQTAQIKCSGTSLRTQGCVKAGVTVRQAAAALRYTSEVLSVIETFRQKIIMIQANKCIEHIESTSVTRSNRFQSV